MGILLVGAGLIALILSYFKYRNTIKQLNEGDYQYSSLLLTLVTFLISVISIFLIGYLIKTT